MSRGNLALPWVIKTLQIATEGLHKQSVLASFLGFAFPRIKRAPQNGWLSFWLIFKATRKAAGTLKERHTQIVPPQPQNKKSVTGLQSHSWMSFSILVRFPPEGIIAQENQSGGFAKGVPQVGHASVTKKTEAPGAWNI